jgi:hypothetical protein
MRASVKAGHSVLRAARPRLAVSLMLLGAIGYTSACLAGAKGTYNIVVNGATVKSYACPNAEGSCGTSGVYTSVGNGYAAALRSVGSAGIAGVSAEMSGTASGQASLSFETGAYTFSLTRPAGGADLANGRFVLYMQLDGQLSGNATIDAAVQVDVATLGPITRTTGSTRQSLADQPGGDSLAFEVPVILPASFPSTGRIQVEPNLVLSATASTSGGTYQASSANAYNTLKAVGFRVFDGAGVQVTGFKMSGSRAIPELTAPPSGLARAVEFYNAAFGHYFITANPAEIANLDSGATPGWARTGESFNVYATGASGLAGVCRFLGVFPPKSSHFYAPMGLGCEALLPSSPVWQYEGIVFYSALPQPDGGCPEGSVPVYRLFNRGQGGAPNHRFTTNQNVQLDMIAAGYEAEGTGTGVGFCSPQ